MSAEKKRLIFVFSMFLVGFAVILGKAFKLQVLDRERLIARSKSQTLREIKVYPKRGSILDRDGHPLAINMQTYSIFTIPKNLKGNYQPIKDLKKIVPSLNVKKLVSKIKKRGKFTWIGRKMSLTREQYKKIKKLKGIHIESVPKRLYPNHELFSQGLGFVGIDNKGLSGLEYLFDDELKGEPKILKYVYDRKGRPVGHESSRVGKKAKSLMLTIDKELQAMAESSLKDAVVKSEAVRGGIGVIDVKTGEILAMANYPTFDANDLSGTKNSDMRFSFISDPIEPGSIMKTLTVASALDHNVAQPDTSIYCEEGRMKVEGHVIKEAESAKKYEWLSVRDIIKYSSNVGTTKIAFDLTFPKLKETFKSFNIGLKTGIELPAESRGIFTNKENVSPLSLSNISFGQGVATTGIQMLAAYGALANDGVYVEPTIIKGKKKRSWRVLSKENADKITSMLIDAVETGTGRAARIPHFKIAGKTSTAQRPDKNGGYNGYIPGFIGYSVNVKNKFAIYVYVDHPQKGGYYGNQVAAPVFKKVAQYLLYKNKELIKVKPKNPAKLAVDKNKLDRVIRKHASTRYLGKNVSPNLMGLDKKSVLKIVERYELRASHVGIGVVKEQYPAPGEELGNSVMKIIYGPPSYE